MRNYRWLFFTLILVLTACNDELKPRLDPEGHWIVDHGFPGDCQVNATFYREQLLVLTFYSLEEGACQPEVFGIRDNALMIDIVSKNDYFGDDGALTSEMEVVASGIGARGTKGRILITETSAGLAGSIMSIENSAGPLEPLLNTTFNLRRVSKDWFSYLRGTWGSGCDPVSANGSCQVLEFRSIFIAAYRYYERCDESLACGHLLESTDLFIALSNVNKIADDQYKLDMVIIGPGSGDNPIGNPITLLVSPSSFEMVGEENKFYPLIQEPVISAP